MTQKKAHSLIKTVFAILFVSVLAWAMWLSPVAEAGLPSRDTLTPRLR